MTRLLIACIAALMVTACNKGGDGKDKGAESAEKVAPAPATPPPAAGEASAQSDDVAPEVAGAGEVPTQQDFEDKAKKEVDQKNLEDEVKKMEKELGAGAK